LRRERRCQDKEGKREEEEDKSRKTSGSRSTFDGGEV